MVNLQCCDKPIANRRKGAIRAPHDWDHYSRATWVSRMQSLDMTSSWCHTEVLFWVELTLEIVRGDCAHSQTQLAPTRR